MDPNDIGPGATDCSIKCGAVAPEIRFSATGGEPPYSWSLTGAPSDCLSGFGGVGGPSFGGPVADGLCDSRFVVTAPSNDPSVTGVAYRMAYQYGKRCGSPFAGFCCCVEVRNDFYCDDSPQGPCEGGGEGIQIDCICTGGTCGFASCGTSGTFQPAGCTTGSCPNGNPCALPDCTNDLPANATCRVDLRSAAQKAAGCVPCQLCFSGLIVTVTDSIGNNASVTVSVD